VSQTPGKVLTLHRPGRWALRHVEGLGRFRTAMTWQMPDGRTARWSSRQARRRGRMEVRDAAGRLLSVVHAEPVTAARLERINRVAAVSFMIGGSLFSLGALFAQLDVGTSHSIDVTYLVGGFFFSLGGYASVLQAVNAPRRVDEDSRLSSGRWRWWGSQPRNLGWLSATVLFVGTLLFAVSLVAAFAQDLTVRQENTWIWLPDMLGCLCFLASGHLAWLEVCHGRIGIRLEELGWWIVFVNQVGSWLFFVAGLAAYVRPATSDSLNVDLANWGTFLGAACFVAGGLLQVFERPSVGEQ
jgi:hypothetical protein